MREDVHRRSCTKNAMPEQSDIQRPLYLDSGRHGNNGMDAPFSKWHRGAKVEVQANH